MEKISKINKTSGKELHPRLIALKPIIETMLKKELNGFLVSVTHRKGFMESIAVNFACSDKRINNVAGQYPQIMGFLIYPDLDMVLLPGSFIYRDINKEDPKEKYLAMQSIKVPFRKPKKEEKFVLKALNTFVTRYKQILKDNIEVLTNQDLVDYKKLLN